MTDFLREQLWATIRDQARKPLVICGAGVSTQATNGVAPSWATLIESGIKRVADLDSNVAEWAAASLGKLTTGDTATWIAIADEVTDKLGGSHNAEFATWLGDKVGKLLPSRRDLLDAILTLNCPVATTNYDDVLVKASGLPVILWGDHAAIHQFLHSERQGILHLHGHWRSPRSVVLGSKSYDEHFYDARQQLLRQVATLDRSTIFIGCSQDGLSDPDFSRLDSFLSEWQDIAPRRYWLIRQEKDESGRPKPLPSPDHTRRLYPVAFGDKYEDLIPLLRSVAPNPSTPDPDASVRCINEHEPNPEIFGREIELETIVQALLAGRTSLVAGGPGMGKTAIATAALYDPRVVSHFGRRRVFASLEAATEPRAILARFAEALGLPSTGDEVSLLRILEAFAGERSLAAVLDNVETVFESNASEAERLLNLVAALNGLSLVVTIRGVPPPVAHAVRIDDLPKLEPGAAQQAFLALAGLELISDPDLPRLLDALDGHALSIHLVAAQAAGLPSLAGLRESWDEAHAEILRRPGQKESRLTSVRASLLLSLNSARMRSTPLARRLLSLLAFLPGGLEEGAVPRLLGDLGTISKARGNELVACLHQLRLVERRPDRRLRMLTPLRECVKLDVPLMDRDRTRIINRYLALAVKAGQIGSKNWEKVREEVETEADNLDPVCELALIRDRFHKQLEPALHGLGEFHNFSGRGAVASLYHAAEIREVSPRLSATCIFQLAYIARARSDLDIAVNRFEEALTQYKRIGDVTGEANCIRGLGDIESARSDYDTAMRRLEQALALFQRIGDVSGEANCLQGLGEIARLRSDHETAAKRFKEALVLYRRIGDVLGEANCIQSVGHIARARSDHETAVKCLEEALALHRRIGDVSGEANCIQSLGGIASFRSDHETAVRRFEEALALHRRIGNLLGKPIASEALATSQARASIMRLLRSASRTRWRCVGVSAAYRAKPIVSKSSARSQSRAPTLTSR